MEYIAGKPFLKMQSAMVQSAFSIVPSPTAVVSLGRNIKSTDNIGLPFKGARDENTQSWDKRGAVHIPLGKNKAVMDRNSALFYLGYIAVLFCGGCQQ